MTETRVIAVVSTYRPEMALVDRLLAISPQVAGIVVVDDGSGPEAAKVLDAASSAGATIVRLSQNSGIATALNAGVVAASENEADFVLIFDQDSLIPPGFVAALEREYIAASRDGFQVGSVSPESFAGIDQASDRKVGRYRLANRPIHSGTLYPRHVLEGVGRFDEALFIDLVDTEYALRLEKNGLLSLVAPGIQLFHSLGASRQVSVMHKSVIVGLSSPFRYYYRSRNRVAVTARYFRRWPLRMIREVLRDVGQFLWPLAFAKQPILMIRILFNGAMDGVMSRGGRIPARVDELARKVKWRGRQIE
jgi:rhamnosyltransferase